MDLTASEPCRLPALFQSPCLGGLWGWRWRWRVPLGSPAVPGSSGWGAVGSRRGGLPANRSCKCQPGAGRASCCWFVSLGLVPCGCGLIGRDNWCPLWGAGSEVRRPGAARPMSRGSDLRMGQGAPLLLAPGSSVGSSSVHRLRARIRCVGRVRPQSMAAPWFSFQSTVHAAHLCFQPWLPVAGGSAGISGRLAPDAFPWHPPSFSWSRASPWPWLCVTAGESRMGIWNLLIRV